MNINLWGFSIGLEASFVLYMLMAGFVAFVIMTMLRNSKSRDGKLEFEYVNEKREKLINGLKKLIINKEEGRKKAEEYEKSKRYVLENKPRKHRTFILDFNGGIMANEAEKLREEITAILTVAQKNDEVVVELNSPGGTVNGYGFAAAQLQRVKDAGLKLTILVDQVAASGGYMMAAVGHKIIASPFAYIGSVGVVAEMPNFHRILKKFDIDYKTYTAGESKRTVTRYGQITPDGERRFKTKLKDIHALFKSHIKRHRPSVNINKIATGESWTAQEALGLKLVDEIRTSDDYILEKIDKSHVYRVSFAKPKTKKKMIPSFAEALMNTAFDRIEKYLQSNKTEF